MNWPVFFFYSLWLVFEDCNSSTSVLFFYFQRTYGHLFKVRSLFLICGELRTPKLLETREFKIFKDVDWKIGLIYENAMFFLVKLKKIVNKVNREIIGNKNALFPVGLINGKNGFLSDNIHRFQNFEISQVWCVSCYVKSVFIVFLFVQSEGDLPISPDIS